MKAEEIERKKISLHLLVTGWCLVNISVNILLFHKSEVLKKQLKIVRVKSTRLLDISEEGRRTRKACL